MIRKPRRRAWSGALWLWPGRAFYVGPAFGTTPHAHHAVQVSLGLTGRLRIRPSPSARWQRVHAALVAPDREHQLDGQGEPLALLYLDPASAEGRAVAKLAGARGLAPVAGPALAACRRAIVGRELRGSAAAGQAAAAVLAALVPGPVSVRPLDPRIAATVRRLEVLADDRLSAAELAHDVGLSQSRFTHLFRTHTGLPLRRYVLWMRLQHAVSDIATGRPFTDAALAAGFADAAHLSRTFRRMFGLAPSELAAAATFGKS